MLLQERAANIWGDENDDANTKQPNAAATARPTVEAWAARQASNDVTTLAMLLSSSGLPFADRTNAWLAWSGAHARRARVAPGYYAALRGKWEAYSAASKASSAAPPSNPPEGFPVDFTASVETIGRDLLRTCQEHHYFAAADGLAVLERVLATSLLHRPALGYTQGMNYLTAFLLLTLQLGGSNGEADSVPEDFLGKGHVTLATVEEDAFWLLDGELVPERERDIGGRARRAHSPANEWLAQHVNSGRHLLQLTALFPRLPTR